MDKGDLPLGFCFALAQDPGAMTKYAALSDDKKDMLLNKAHAVSSKDEMQALIRHFLSASD